MSRARSLAGMDEWNWDEGGDHDASQSKVMSRQSMSCFAFPDPDTRMAILQSMEVELKRINARRLWDYGFRCVRFEQAQRAAHILFRRRVMKNRAQTKYVALWQRCETLERQVSGGGAPAAVNAQVDTTNPSASAADELKKVKDELTEIEEAAYSLHSFSSGGGLPKFWEVKSPLLDYAEVLHCRKLAMANSGSETIAFDPAPPTSIASAESAAGPELKASLTEFRIVLASPPSHTADTADVTAVSFALGQIDFAQSSPGGVTEILVKIKDMALVVETGADGVSGSFDCVRSKDPTVDFLEAKIAMEPLLMKVTSRIGCVTCFSDLRPLNFLNKEMAAANTSAKSLMAYAPLFEPISSANEAVKYDQTKGCHSNHKPTIASPKRLMSKRFSLALRLLSLEVC